MTEESGRVGLNINLSPKARAIIEKIREDSGVPNTEAMSRILEWFAFLDRKLRLAILNRDEPTKRELIRLVLVDMAATGSPDDGLTSTAGPVDAADAIKTAQLALRRLETIITAQNRQNPKKPKGG